MRVVSYFWIFLALYLGLGILNLETLPVVWNDEIQNLDPAVRHWRTGQWTSWLWPNPGATELFASYPPFLHHWHRLWLSIFPLHPFWMRLPFWLFHGLSLVLLFRLLQKHMKPEWALGLVLLFAWDRSVFEIARSVRVEPIAMALLLLYNLPLRWGRAWCLTLLASCHLLYLPFVLILAFWEWRKTDSIVQKIALLTPSLLLLTYLNYHYHSNWVTAFQQISYQIEKHSQNGFISWFQELQYTYKQAPLQALVWALGIGLLARLAVNRSYQKGPWFWAFIAYAATLLFAQPLHRYWPMAYLLLILAIGEFSGQDTQELGSPKYIRLKLQWLLGLAILNGFALFAARHVAALADRPARLADPALEWLDSCLIDAPAGSLITGSALGAYAAYRHPQMEYGMPDYLQTFEHWPDSISCVYVLDFGARHRGPDTLHLPNAELLGTYQPPRLNAWQWPGESYEGMKLYRLKQANDWHLLIPKP